MVKVKKRYFKNNFTGSRSANNSLEILFPEWNINWQFDAGVKRVKMKRRLPECPYTRVTCRTEQSHRIQQGPQPTKHKRVKQGQKVIPAWNHGDLSKTLLNKSLYIEMMSIWIL